MTRQLSHLRLHAVFCVAALGIFASQPAQAIEGGFSAYLLGTGGPGAAVMPPLEGVFFDNTSFFYDGSAGAEKQFLVGGNLVVGLDAAVFLNATTLMWVPTTDFLGGTLAVGAVGLLGYSDITVSGVITGPLGNQVDIEREDDLFTAGDPAVVAQLGWKTGKLHTALGLLVNVPVGDYKPGRLANVSLNRWAVDTSFAVSWHDDELGWDVSGKVGYTFEGTNPATDYNSGDGVHFEGAIEKRLGKAFSLGVQGYYYVQTGADTGAGARLGPFKGEVGAIGGTAAYNFMIGRAPISVRARVLRELDSTNRLKGTEIFFSLGLPLWVNMPRQVD